MIDQKTVHVCKNNVIFCIGVYSYSKEIRKHQCGFNTDISFLTFFPLIIFIMRESQMWNAHVKVLASLKPVFTDT